MTYLAEVVRNADDKLFNIRRERNVLISLSDGVSLAADLYLPDVGGTFPALLSYYPYHKDDLIGASFEYSRQYFTERGYATLLVDYRGTGGSEGICRKTFDTHHEAADAAEVIEWVAGQPWCDGSVGFWGMSYGGLISLAIAALRPAHLKAILPLFGCADVYTDFVSPGGCPNCLGTYAWESFMLAMNLMPPMYQDPAGRWLQVWKERLERLVRDEPYSFEWQEHPDYDSYWQGRSIPVERISVPTFIIGGWRDIFPEAMPGAYERISAPKKMLMGPWLHVRPDVSPFEPVDWLYEARRWWDYWLKGEQNGIMDEPSITVFVQGCNAWKHEREWPITRTEKRSMFLGPGGDLLDESTQDTGGDVYQAIPTVGTTAPLWDPLATGMGYPLDQAPDDHNSLTYISHPLGEGVEITGSPDVKLYVALESGEDLQLVAKLNDVAPDGRSTNISTGWLRAPHRIADEPSEAPRQGAVCEVRIPMWATSYYVPKDHRLRLCIACSDFPRVWPSRTNPTIRLWSGKDFPSVVRLPIVPPPLSPVPGPPISRPHEGVNRQPWVVAYTPQWEIHRDVVGDRVAISLGAEELLQLPTGGRVHFLHTATASVSADRPDGAKVEAEARVEISMPAGEAINIRVANRFTRDRMLLTATVIVDDRLFLERQWMNYYRSVT